MIYDNTTVRRQDRLLDEADAMRLLANGEHGFMSMVTPEGQPYGVPVNYVWDGADAIYIHCAPEGTKLRCIEACPAVTFVVVGPTEVIPHRFTTNYSSILLRCEAEVVANDEERMEALRMIVGKYASAHKTVGEKYARGSFHRTAVIKLRIVSCSGKCKNIDASKPLS